ncbi:MAG TPA: hypothetical protein VFM41_05125 [Gaiella sp.]|jgi:hypothetical protein|nr:hypothetical protein [Gaiella sp.]
MSPRKLFLVAAACIASGAIATGAVAGRTTSTSVTTIKAVTSTPKMVVNRYIQDNLRWDKNVYKVKSGGTLHVVNDAADEGPHTFTVVVKKDAPRTGLQAVNCKICLTLAKAHGANPNTDAPPKFPFLENGVGQKTPPNVDRPGDSGVTGPGKKGESIDLKVTAPTGTKLYFICLIHPWMQAQVDVT